MRFFSWIIDIIFPPRATQSRVAVAYRAPRSSSSPFAGIFRPCTIKIEHLSITTLLPYRSPLVEACVLEAKFHTNDEAQELLGAVLAKFLLKYVHAIRSTDTQPDNVRENFALVPIPLSTKRRKERGYNQVEEIARFCLNTTEKEMRIPSEEENSHETNLFRLETALIERTRDTNPQTTLGREARKENMRGAFVGIRPLDPETTYILLDDVVTTGATLLAAHTALENGGATKIFIVALAH